MIATLRLVCDSGLLVLIWIVQLIIYPSFAFYSHKNLFTWHKIYTKRIALVVIPLMVTQLIISLLQVYTNPNIYSILYSIMVISAWLLTFIIFVPLHHDISNEIETDLSIKKIKLHNWSRTVLWSLIFILTIYSTFKPW